MAENPENPGRLMHFIKYSDGFSAWVMLKTEKFQIVKRYAWRTHGHDYIGRELSLKIGVRRSVLVEEPAKVVAWLPAFKDDPEIFKVERDDHGDDSEWHVFKDLEAW